LNVAAFAGLLFGLLGVGPLLVALAALFFPFHWFDVDPIAFCFVCFLAGVLLTPVVFVLLVLFERS
jgi:hypothetical protein